MHEHQGTIHETKAQEATEVANKHISGTESSAQRKIDEYFTELFKSRHKYTYCGLFMHNNIPNKTHQYNDEHKSYL